MVLAPLMIMLLLIDATLSVTLTLNMAMKNYCPTAAYHESMSQLVFYQPNEQRIIVQSPANQGFVWMSLVIVMSIDDQRRRKLTCDETVRNEGNRKRSFPNRVG